MSLWFHAFNRVLEGEEPQNSLQLIAAGNATMAEALEHVRYQFEAKTIEAVEDTYPETIKAMGAEKWQSLWQEFVKTKPASPRGLDHYPAVFLAFFKTTDAPESLKQLMEFENVLDCHPWSHPRLYPVELGAFAMTGTVVLQLPQLDIRSFKAPVMALYEGKQVFDDQAPEDVLFWLLADGMRFQRLQVWERQVLEHLHLGLGEALAFAPDDAEEVSRFFQWLGQSGLIRAVSELPE